MAGRARAAGLALAAATLAACLAILECGLGAFSPQVIRVPRVWQHDAQLGWAHRPGARGRLVEPELDVEIAINAEGLRGPEVGVARPDGTRRIALFGDSFTEGWGVEEHETLRARLEVLGRARGEAVEVLNFGVAGYGTDQALLAWAQRGVAFSPDVAVLLFFANDLWDNGNQRGIGGRGVMVPKPFFSAPAAGGLVLGGVPVPRVAGWDPPLFGSPAWWAGLWPALQERSHLASLGARAFDPRRSAPSDPRYFLGLYGPPDPRSRAAWTLAGRIVEAFAGEVRRAEARFVVAYVPANIEVEPETWRAARAHQGLEGPLDLERPSRELGAIATSAGAEFVDLLPVFRAAPAPAYLREGHWNAAGHALAAAILDERLQAP